MGEAKGWAGQHLLSCACTFTRDSCPSPPPHIHTPSSLLPLQKAEIPALASAIYPLVDSHSSEFLPYSSAYIEAENLRKILKPDSPLALDAAENAPVPH